MQIKYFYSYRELPFLDIYCKDIFKILCLLPFNFEIAENLSKWIVLLPENHSFVQSQPLGYEALPKILPWEDSDRERTGS